MKRTSLVIGILMLPLIIPVSAQRRRSARGSVQTGFGPETEIKRRAHIPEDVLSFLVKENNERLQACLESQGKPATQIARYFAASAIDINGDGEPDLVVQ